jgi:hypothetical protein
MKSLSLVREDLRNLGGEKLGNLGEASLRELKNSLSAWGRKLDDEI